MLKVLLLNEITKAARGKVTWLGLAAVLALCLLVYAAAGEMEKSDTVNAWGYVSFSMQLAFTDVGVIFVVIFSAMLVSDETGSGTVRTVLSTPVLRWEFYAAKTLMGLVYMAFLSGATLAASAILGAWRLDYGDIADSAGLIYPAGKVFTNLAAAFFLSWIPLVSVVMYGILISTVVRKAGQAVAIAIGVLYLVDFSKHLIGIEPYVFTKYIGLPWQVIGQMAQGVDYQWSTDIWRMAAMSLAYSAAMFAAGLLIFSRRDLNG